ncbi:MAG: DUF2760 domain-containing protein [Alphaproteobacteria bacterium]
MRTVSILLALILLVLAALALTPKIAVPPIPLMEMAFSSLPSVTAAVSALLFIIVLADRPRPWEMVVADKAPVEAATVPEANRCNAEVVSFLSILQEKGRLVDFLMDDVGPYSDAQVGAAARVLHEGCRTVLKEHFGIVPVRGEAEGAGITVPSEYASDEYRLVGRISGNPPFSGTLVHHGWKVEWVRLPRLVEAKDGRLPTIAPAEVEL